MEPSFFLAVWSGGVYLDILCIMLNEVKTGFKMWFSSVCSWSIKIKKTFVVVEEVLWEDFCSRELES